MKMSERNLRILGHIVSYCGQIEMALDQGRVPDRTKDNL